MQKIPPMGPEEESRILRAFDAAVDDPAIDSDPDAALAKAAAAAGVPRGHLPILARAYNNSRAAAQREAGDDLLSKAAEHPLASEAAVVEAAYPSRPETKAARAARIEPSPEYLAPPDWSRSRAPAPPTEAFLREKLARGPAPAPYAADRDSAYRNARARGRDAMRRVDAARDAASAASRAAKTAIESLAGALSATAAPAWPDVRPAALALHGEAGVQALAAAVRRRPGLAKRASAGRYHRPSDSPEVHAALALAVAAVKRADDAADALDAALPGAAAEVADAMAPFAPPEQPDPRDELLEGIVEKSAGPVDFARQMMQALAVGRLRDMAEPPDSVASRGRDSADDLANSLFDPAHEARVRDLENQYAVQSMLIDDPILSSYDPRDVGATYDEISTTNPHLAAKPLLMRPLLRKALVAGGVGGLDSFDAGQALDQESRLQQSSKLPLEMAKYRQDLSAPARAPKAPAPAKK